MGAVFAVQEPRSAALRALNYLPEAETFRRAGGGRRSAPLGSMLSSMGRAYGAVFTRIDCAPSEGIELVSQGDMLAAEPAGRVIRRDSMAQPERHEIKRWQILIAGAGTLGETEMYGRSLIADGRLVGKYVGPHAMVLTFQEPGGRLNLYVYALLCSAFGVRAIRSLSFGTKILGIRKDLLADFPIPIPDDETQERIAALIRTTVEARERYLTKLRAARKVVEDLSEMQEALGMCGERKARCITWDRALPTLSAWTFASTGGALGYLKTRWSGRLGDVLEENGLFNGPRFARIPCLPPHGVDFLSQRDVFLIRPVPRRIVHPGFDERLLFVSANSLVVAAQGTLGDGEIFGQTTYVSSAMASQAMSQHLLRLWPTAVHSAAAYSFLSTKVGFRLLRSTAVGTKLLSMRPDLLRELPFPDCPPVRLQLITAHLDAAMAARASADDAEAEAVRIIEQEVLPAWLA